MNYFFIVFDSWTVFIETTKELNIGVGNIEVEYLFSTSIDESIIVWGEEDIIELITIVEYKLLLRFLALNIKILSFPHFTKL